MAGTAAPFPPTTLLNDAGAPLANGTAKIELGGQTAVLYADPSRNVPISNRLTADSTGTISPATQPVYADNGTYTVTYTPSRTGTGASTVVNVTVAGGTIPTSYDPSAITSANLATLSGPNTFAAGAVGLNGNPPVGKAAAPAAVAAAGVVVGVMNPANAIYTQGDQTALAAQVQGAVTTLNQLVATVASIRTALSALGITA